MAQEAKGLAHVMLRQRAAQRRGTEPQPCAGQSSSEEDEDHITDRSLGWPNPRTTLSTGKEKKVLNTCSLGQEEKYMELSSQTFGIFSSENTEIQRGGLDHKILKAPIKSNAL